MSRDLWSRVLLSLTFVLSSIGLHCYFPSAWTNALMITVVVTSVLTPAAILLGSAIGVVDRPGGRRIHELPTPRLGGLAVGAGLALVMVLYPLKGDVPRWGIALGGLIMAGLGLWDDLRGAPAAVRLIGQVAAAAAVVASNMFVTFVPPWGVFERFLEVSITMGWLIGITNAFNMLDGIDGLASGLGIVSGLAFLAVGWSSDQVPLMMLGSALVGACAGFLPYNLHKAKIFLGETGATLLGFLLACCGIAGSWAETRPLVSLSIPVLIVGVPIFDMIYTTISRIRNGLIHSVKEWLEYAGTDHFHHRLLALGYSQPQAVWVILSVSSCVAISAVVLHDAEPGDAALLMLQGIMFFLLVVSLMLVGREHAESQGGPGR